MALLYAVYYAFLRKDTFFKTNRFFLISSLLLSSVLPFIDPGFLLPAREQMMFVLLDPLVISPEGIQASLEEYSGIYQIIAAVYLTGVVIFSIRFLYQIGQLVVLVRQFGITRSQGMLMVFTNKNFSPFSFFNLIFISGEDVDAEESGKIIAHERIHIRQWHSLDLVLLEFITILQWFNPFVWGYRHAIKTLHEYLADEGVLHGGVDVKVYSALLFEQSTGIQINDLANNFSKSLLKRRFTMMTKKRTTQFARAKLLFALPLALSAMLVISISPDIFAQQTEKVPPPPPKEPAAAVAPVSSADQEPETITHIELAPGGQDQEDQIFMVVEEMPEYPGGRDKMYSFLGENIKYPEKARQAGISGTVYVTFVIEKDGSITNIKILRGAAESLDKEAVRIINLMPAWEPGKQRGKTVRVQYNLPIKFKLDDGEEKDKEKK
jgi:TonB family protein